MIINIGQHPISLNYNLLSVRDYTPHLLNSTYVNKNSFIINISQLIGVDGYSIDVSTSPTFNTLIINNYDNGNNLTYLVNGLSQLTNYYIRVRSYKTNFISPNSNIMLTTTTNTSNIIEYFIVSGGNSSNGQSSGGGAGGFILTNTNYQIDVNSDNLVFIGAGGSYGSLGDLSKINDITTQYNINNGAGGGTSAQGPVSSNPQTIGYRGGYGYSSGYYDEWYNYNDPVNYLGWIGYGGGGGGATSVGGNATSSNIGYGGTGLTSSFRGTSTTYSKGGDGAHSNLTIGSPGTTNRGNGGGGCGPFELGYYGQPGGSGVVYIKYITSNLPTMIGGTKSSISGGYTLHTFSTSGIFKKQ